MLRKIFGLLMMGLLALPVFAQEEPVPPDGFFLALVDVNAKIGENISLVCSDPNDGSTCGMSDVRLNWAWAMEEFPDANLGCPSPNPAAQVISRAYRYFFAWEGVAYEYREPFPPNGTVYFCGAYGLEPIGLAAPLPSVTPTPAASAPSCPAALPPRLTVGGRGRVTPGDPNNLRAAPGTNQPKVGQIPGEGDFDVLEGPQCASGMYWWRVRYQGQEGWTGEGKDGVYWLEPIGAAAMLALPSNRLPISSLTAEKLRLTASLKGVSPLAWSGYGLLAVSELAADDTGGQSVLVYDVGAGVPQPKVLESGQIILDAAFSPTFTPSTVLLALLVIPPNADALTPSIQLWDAFVGVELYSLDLSPSAQQIVFSPDGSLLAVSYGDLSGQTFGVYLVNPQAGDLVGNLPQAGYVSGMAFSPDGTTLATGVGESQVSLWDVPTRSLITSLPAQPNPFVAELAFSPDGRTLAIVSVAPPDVQGKNSFFIDLWDISTRAQLRKLTAETFITAFAFSPDGTLLALAQSSVQDRTGRESVQIWEVASGALLTTIPAPLGAITDVAFSDDGTLLAFANFLSASDSNIDLYAIGQ